MIRLNFLFFSGEKLTVRWTILSALHPSGVHAGTPPKKKGIYQHTHYSALGDRNSSKAVATALSVPWACRR